MRRTSLLAAVTAGLLLVSACGSSTDDSPTTSAPGQVTATETPGDDEATTTAAPSPTSTTPTSPTATQPASPTTSAAPTPTSGGEAPGTPTGGPVPTPPEGVECSTGAFSPGTLRTGGAPQPVVDTAEALFHAAMACDQAALVERAEADTTFLTFGGGSAEEVLGLPDVENRYLAIAALLTGTSPAQNDDLTWVWPAVFVTGSDADWQELVDAGLYSAADVEQMRTEGYYGWRIGIAQDGTWSFFVAGD